MRSKTPGSRRLRPWRILGGLAVALLLFPRPLVAEEAIAGIETLSLDEALALALRNNRLVRSAVLDVSRAEEKVGKARSYRWPTLSVDFLGSYLATPIDLQFPKGAFGDFAGIGPVPARDTKVSGATGWSTYGLGQLKVPLSQQYEIGLNVDLAKLAAETSREQLRGQRQATVAEVRNAYYALVEADAALSAAKESLAHAREIERVVGEKFRAEKALEVDHLESRARLASAEGGELRARNSLAQAKERLNDLLGRDLGVEYRVANVPDPPDYPLDLAAARALSLERQPAVREARLQVQQAEQSVRIAKAQFIPDLGLAATYFNPYSVDFLPKNILTLGAFFEWEILDGGRRSHDVAEKGAQLEQARLNAARAESATLLDVGDKYRRLEEARTSLDAAELNRKARRERLRIARDRFGQQVIVAEDLLRAQADFADAERQYFQALAAFGTARAGLERAVGEEVR